MPSSERIGFVASSFDLIHPGYVLMLQDAKTVCDYLVCALQDDPSIERLGKNKPVQTLEERRLVLGSIKYVDKIVTYQTEAELLELLKELKPDIRILGTDYKNKDYTGKELNIPIHWHKRDHEWSTSSLRKRIIMTAAEKK